MNPRLLLAAKDAVNRLPYAPYSGHPVAAAGLRDGRVFVGVNVENAINRLSVCAEQSLISVVISAGYRPAFDEIVIVGPEGKPLAPCGACRQLLVEHCDPETPVNGRPLSSYLPDAPVIIDLS